MQITNSNNKIIHRFRSDGKMYFYYEPDNWKIEDFSIIKQFKDSGYNQTGVSFDIETTSYINSNGEHRGTMWHWQIGIGPNAICGRDWESCVKFFNLMNEYAIRENFSIIVWVQNFSFEWQWIKGWFDWNIKKKTGFPDVFAKSDREILKANTGNLEFRCSMTLANCGLAKFQKNYNLSIGKLDGDLDYELIRTSKTKTITNKERAYCINDVLVLTEWHEKYIISEFISKNKEIPLTSTGIVRADIKDAFNELPKSERKEYKTEIRNAFPSLEMYQVFRENLFRGGLVHANASLCNALLDSNGDGAGEDLKSAHPGNALLEKFPYKFYRMNKNNWKLILEECRTGDFAFFGSFRFYEIQAKGWHCLESKNKLVDYSSDAFFENGRLACCNSSKDSFIEVVLTELDFFNYEKMYDWKRVECDYIYESEKKPLPDFVRKTFCKYFDLKEHTDKEKDGANYTRIKQKLNGIFGMMSTGIIMDEIVYNPKTQEFEPSGIEKSYYSVTKDLLLLPQWSIWIANYSRNIIVDALCNIGVDACYYDTDSVKVLNFSKHKDYFDKYNAERMKRNEQMEIYGYDMDIFRKLTCFEFEYKIDRMKVLGAKRYIVEHDGKIDVTVAGMKKGSLESFCKKHNLNIWDYFQNKLILPPDESGKTTTGYFDEPFDDELTDYEGLTAPIHEKSCVAIFKIPFEMKVEKAFLERIRMKTEERKHHFYKGVT